MFAYCSNLTNVEIPCTVKNILESSFEGCIELANIEFNGTKVQWNKIYKNPLWDYDTVNYTIHCTDGTI